MIIFPLCWHYDECVVLDGNPLVAEQEYGNELNLQDISEVIEWWNIIMVKGIEVVCVVLDI